MTRTRGRGPRRAPSGSPGVPPGDRPCRHPRARRARLPAHAGVVAGADAGRHQALPVPRSGGSSSDAPWSWDTRQFGGWVPHQTISYLWPSGPWYWLFEHARRAGVDRPPAVARHAARGRWPRRALARSPPRPTGRRRARRRARLPALAVHPPVRLADVAHAAAVGRPRLAHRADDARRAAGRLAPPCDHRSRPRHGRRTQRHRDPHDRARARAVARARHLPARDQLAAGHRDRGAHRCARAR